MTGSFDPRAALVTAVLDTATFARARGIALPADVALGVRWAGVMRKAWQEDSHPRILAGSPEGGQWTSSDFTRGVAGSGMKAETIAFVIPAIEEAQTYGLETGEEKLIVMSRSGQVLGETTGDSSSVSDVDAMRNPDAFVAIHNHPSSSSFSDGDILLFLNTPIEHMVVIGHDGTIYTMDKTGREPWMPNFPNKMAEEYDKYLMKFMPDFRRSVLSGKLNQHEAQKEHSHLITGELAKDYSFRYRRIDPS